MSHARSRWVLTCLVLLATHACKLSSAADAPTTPPPAKPSATPTAKITRADLAASLLRLETAYFARPVEGDERIKINKGFDQATLAFFTGRNADALEAIDGLANALRQPPATPLEQAAAAVKVTVEPAVWNTQQTRAAYVRLASLYKLPEGDLPAAIELRLIAPDGKTVATRPIDLKVDAKRALSAEASLDAPFATLASGVYRLELAAVGGAAIPIGRVNVVAGGPLDEQRAKNEKRLAEIKAGTPALEQALASCRGRNAMLSDQLSEANSAQFLADLDSLAKEVSQEIDELAAGRDPYIGRLGDYWRVLKIEGGEVPLRVYAPKAAAKKEPLPVLVALHGAGGDENMFFAAYGVGAIKRIAEEKGLLVVSPTTYKFGGSPKRLEQLLDAIALDYQIDRSRVYVLGHSMGAGATAGLVRGQAKLIKAACCIAGGNNFQSKDGMPPLLAIVAELDAVVPAASVQAAAKKAADAGMPVELRTMNGYGHTLVVGAVLGDAVEWMMKK